jgi:hypothetical protein
VLDRLETVTLDLLWRRVRAEQRVLYVAGEGHRRER